MSQNPARRTALALLALCCITASSSAASAATVTIEPSPAEARTFATTNGGWTSLVDYGGYSCIPGVTCPTANPSYRTTGGTGGPADGHLRNTFGTLLGVLTTTTISWTSPSFVAPASIDTATLRFSVRPQIASLNAIGSVNITVTLVDVDDGTQSTTLPAIPLTVASASFGQQTVTIPPSAVVAGRSYRVRIGTSHTTNVSAVTSGNVDLDDVVLTLTDLDLPTGLTASIPATGPTRVVGTVDPNGSDTEIAVEYGLTASYGSTSGTQTVGGIGSQPFEIELDDLTAGATYHYRVTATNGDGSVSTDDATFVVPAGPDNPVPTVTGAVNSPGRTITFTRGSDVTSAVVELLDGDDEVLETYPDSEGNGVVGITLPADGSYGVRVVRTNESGQSSTSAIVPLTFDSTPPDTSNLAIEVTPAISNALERTVSFTRPADAVTVVAQALNADDVAVGLPATVVGSSAAVTVGPADGDYRVRLTLTDAAGNAADATSDVVTLDRVAPDAGPAPAVAGAGNVRQRTVTFTRDPSAATVEVEVLADGGAVLDTVPVPSGSSASITLPDADATYGVRVRQTDAAGNGAESPTADVVLDRVAPDVSALAPTVTPVLSNERDRTLTIVRPADAATVSAQVIDAADEPVGSPVTIAATTGTITLGSGDGSYRVVVTATDAAGNSAAVTSSPVTLDRTAPDAGPAPTVSGDANLRERTVTFTRDPSATTVAVEILHGGSVVVTVPVAGGETSTITLPDADGDYGVRIRQTDDAGNDAASSTTDVVLDRTAPDLSALDLTVTPVTSSAVDRTVTIVRPADAETVRAQVIDAADQPVGPSVVIAGTTGTVMLGAVDGSYRVVVTVADAAGNGADATSAVLTLDTVAPDAGPAPTVTGVDGSRERTVTFTRDPSAEAVEVEILGVGDAVRDRVPVVTGASVAITLPDEDGTHRVRVRQTDAAGNTAVSPASDVTLDRVGPDPGPVPAIVGTPDALEVTFRRAPDAVSVRIEVRDAAGAVVMTVPVPTGERATIQLPAGAGRYTVRVVQTDAAGNSRVTDDIAAVRPGDPVPGPSPAPAEAPPAAPTCTKPALVLTNVRRSGSRVRISGFSTHASGTRVAINETGGEQVGTATVGATGTFSVTVAGPRSAAQRDRVGYRASVERHRSPSVRLRQTNDLRRVTRSGDTVTLTGRVNVQRPSRFSKLEVYGGTGSCTTINKRLRTIGKPRINRRTGTYTVRIRVPASDRLVVKTRATIGGGNYHSTHTVEAGR